MSKSALKKHLLTLDRVQIIEQILELYDNCKPAKEYFEYYLQPNEKEQFLKYKAIIVNEFYPKGRNVEPKTRFSVAKKAIADFKSLKPSDELLADLLLTLPEMACQFTKDFGDMWEQYYTSAATNYEVALKFLAKSNQLEQFKLRCKTCVENSNWCGYGFTDEMKQLFFDYYNEQPIKIS